MKWVIIIAALLCAGCDSGARIHDESEKLDPVVYQDRKTGCEYLTTGQKITLTPRMDASGKQICGGKQ